MRALEFIMRGRAWAMLIVFLGIPLLSPAVLALVNLRKGISEGQLLLAVALVPIAFTLVLGGESQIGTSVALVQVVSTFIGAVVLRSTRSWVLTLLASLGAIAVGVFFASYLSGGLRADLLAGIEALEVWPPEMAEQMFSSEAIVSGGLAFWSGMYVIACLMLARWWQALLYNPGGFQEEFHQLRIPLPLAAISMLLWLYCLANPEFAYWGVLIALPMVVAGVSLIHWLVASRGWGRGPLVALYVLLVIATLPLVGFMCGLALIDSWIDIRGRLAK